MIEKFTKFGYGPRESISFILIFRYRDDHIGSYPNIPAYKNSIFKSLSTEYINLYRTHLENYLLLKLDRRGDHKTKVILNDIDNFSLKTILDKMYDGKSYYLADRKAFNITIVSNSAIVHNDIQYHIIDALEQLLRRDSKSVDDYTTYFKYITLIPTFVKYTNSDNIDIDTLLGLPYLSSLKLNVGLFKHHPTIITINEDDSKEYLSMLEHSGFIMDTSDYNEFKKHRVIKNAQEN